MPTTGRQNSNVLMTIGKGFQIFLGILLHIKSMFSMARTCAVGNVELYSSANSFTLSPLDPDKKRNGMETPCRRFCMNFNGIEQGQIVCVAAVPVLSSREDQGWGTAMRWVCGGFNSAATRVWPQITRRFLCLFDM